GIEPGEELKALQRRILAQDPSLGVRTDASKASTDGGAEDGSRRGRRRRRRWLVGAIAAAAAVVALTVAAAALSLRHDDARPPPVPVADSVLEIDPGTNQISSVVKVGKGAYGLAA